MNKPKSNVQILNELMDGVPPTYEMFVSRCLWRISQITEPIRNYIVDWDYWLPESMGKTENTFSIVGII